MKIRNVSIAIGETLDVREDFGELLLKVWGGRFVQAPEAQVEPDIPTPTVAPDAVTQVDARRRKVR